MDGINEVHGQDILLSVDFSLPLNVNILFSRQSRTGSGALYLP